MIVNNLQSIGVVMVVLVLGLSSFTTTSYSESDTGSIEVEVKYTNTDRVDFNGMKFVVYQDFDKEPFLLQGATSNPYTIDSLPIGHKYKVEVYVNSMYGAVAYDLQTNEDKVELTIPLSGGLRIYVTYENGEKPFSGATVLIRSHDGKQWREGSTNDDGKTFRFWIQSTGLQDEYYQADILLGTITLYSHFPITLQAGLARDVKIVVPVPEVVDDLITVYVYKSDSETIGKSDGDFSVVLYDDLGNKVEQSRVFSRGQAYFSNIKTGQYFFEVTGNAAGGKDFQWPKTEVLITGEQNTFEIFKVEEAVIEVPSLEEPPDGQSPNTILTCNCVAFRFDDVQNFWLNEAQIQIIKTLTEKNVPFTVGIVGSDFGADQTLVNFLKQTFEKNELEIANHGIDNESMTNFNKDEQSLRIRQQNDQIFKVFGKRPEVFIPPQNRFNDDTIAALKDNKMKYLSSSLVQGEVPPFPLENATLYRFPEITTTGRYDPGLGVFVGVPSNQVFSEALDGLEQFGFAVITLHPQEFSVIKDGTYSNEANSEQLRELELLIDKVQGAGLEIVPVGQINLDSNIVIPQWIKNNAGWWADGQIEDSDFVSGIQYLINQGIMVIPQTQSQEGGSETIPDWIKNNAGWWSEGLISDLDFVNGIEYLITQGIIKY